MHPSEDSDLDLILIGLMIVASAGFLAAGWAIWMG